MGPDALADYFRDKLESKVVGTKVAYGQVTVTVEPDAFPLAARLCKEDPDLGFDFFDFLAGVDERDEGFAVVAHLYSVAHRHHVSLRAVADGGREDPRLPSITAVYRGADWHERETYDMFGVVFEGHPGLLPRILTVENFEGFPLRKDFLLSTREAKPWPGAKEPEAHDEGAGQPATTIATPGPASAEDKLPMSAEDKAAAAKAKAERAKAKAAEMRKRKAAERAAAEGEAPAADTAGEGPPAEGDAEEARAAAPAAAGGDVEAGTPASDTPEGAAEIAQTDVAKDAAAGAVQGDTAAGAPGDQAGIDEPVDDLAAETAAGTGGPPTPSGTPGVEAEGRHGGAEVQSGDKPAAETPGMDESDEDDQP